MIPLGEMQHPHTLQGRVFLPGFAARPSTDLWLPQSTGNLVKMALSTL